VSAKIGKLPDKALFSNNAPNKVDQRKVAIEQYLQQVIALPLNDNTDLFEFLSTDIINAKPFQVNIYIYIKIKTLPLLTFLFLYI
jgi:hypothetical protein